MEIGDKADARLTVQLSDTAYALSLSDQDTFPEVSPTSRMVALMELAAARLMKPILNDDQLSVGVSVNVQHTAASALGSQIRAVATYVAPEGRLFRFRVEAFDDAGSIGEGDHVRAIIDMERLMAGAARRRKWYPLFDTPPRLLASRLAVDADRDSRTRVQPVMK